MNSEIEEQIRFIFIDQLHFRWLEILLYRVRDESSYSYLDNVMFDHLKWDPSAVVSRIKDSGSA